MTSDLTELASEENFFSHDTTAQFARFCVDVMGESHVREALQRNLLRNDLSAIQRLNTQESLSAIELLHPTTGDAK